MKFAIEVDYTPNVYLSDLTNFIARKLNKDFYECAFTLKQQSNSCTLYSIPALEDALIDNSSCFYEKDIFQAIIDEISKGELPKKFRGIIDV